MDSLHRKIAEAEIHLLRIYNTVSSEDKDVLAWIEKYMDKHYSEDKEWLVMKRKTQETG
jgi:hypothetical protein